MGYSYAYEIEEALTLGILPAIVSGVPSFALSIAAYVLTALALYTVAKRRGLKHPWLAWIPVADAWLLGSISDQYRYVVKREYKFKRKILLILQIISKVCATAGIILCSVAGTQLVHGIMNSASQDQLVGAVIGPAIGLLGICVPLVGVTIAYVIIRYMAMYDVYNSLDPKNSVVYLVLSILFNITEPFFLFFNRNKDEGMPPRKEQAPPPAQESYVYEQPQDPPQEPWENQEPDYL